MHDKANVRLVHTHAEGDGGNEHTHHSLLGSLAPWLSFASAIVSPFGGRLTCTQKAKESSLLCLPAQPSMVGQRLNT
eukprot:CAMPEP_0115133302 /NCGR_PEP_ID=MMETSP0227-20121206/54339_1 /TAXON_ID=89957 /ORGANISM="Polarella glacialis, Strain CCMP 1383" /LENGTH=76 /DNA_ID=CAMNT_0002539403 /DNA_START=100 /DNA_END=327 /DNA_ORIENTATION=-